MKTNKGYKALGMKMESVFGGNTTYELNKVYEIPEEDLKIYKRGYHYYKKLEDMLNLYFLDISENRIFEVEILGKEVTDNGSDYCTNKIKLVRELTREDIDQYFNDHADDLMKRHWEIRRAVAEEGYCLDKLINDEDWAVRRAVARQGYGLDKLVHDKEGGVRIAVAEEGYCLDKLINDEDWAVRRAVARQGYGLDKLVHDKDADVREAAELKIEKRKRIK